MDPADAERFAALEATVAGLEQQVKELAGRTPGAAPVHAAFAPVASAAPAAPAEQRATDEVRALVLAGHKIEAIKLVRERTGLGLKDAKDFVDRL